MSYPINVVSHDSWHERDRFLIEDPPELTPVIQEHLKCLSESLSETLHPALILERRFGEQNNKTMFLAPFIRSVIHASVTDTDIQHISLFPLAVDPCVTPDPLFRTFLETVRPPCYGFVTGIICGSIPFPIDRSETNENENNALSVQDFVDEEESDSEEPSVNFVEWINASSRSRRKKGASTTFYHNKIPSVSDRSTVLDHSFLARLTVDIAEETTPLSLFCIGQEAALQSALISCLFQRSAWGIRDPLVGIVLDRTTTVRILVAWLEDSAEPDCFVVHIAQDRGGYYDLSDASEALKFASIIANVGRQFSTICRTAMAFTDQLKQDISEGRLKHWRLDQAELVPCFVLEKEPTLNAKVEGWRTGVSERIKDDKFTLSPSSPTNMSPRTAKSKSNTNSPAPSINVQEERDDRSSEKPTLSSKVSTDSLAPRVGSSAGKASIAASRLAAGNGDADKGRRTRFWTFSRLSVSRTLFPYIVLKNETDAGKGKTGSSEDIYLNFCSQYYSIVPFSWFDTDVEAPLATSHEVQKLLIAGQSGVDDYKSLERIGQYPPYKPLSQECDKVLRTNLDEVASVYSAIQNLSNSGKANLKEVECRHSLDRLMMKFFHGNINGSADILQDYSKPHVMVSLERSLMLPRAFVAERCQSLSKVPRVTLMADVAAELNFSLSRDRVKVARVVDERYPSSDNVAALATKAGSSTLDEVTQRARFEQDIRPLIDIVIDASKPERYTALDPEDMSDYHKEEPTWAICDSVGFIRIQNVFTANTASSAFNLIHPPTTFQLKERESKYKSTDAEGADGAGAKTVTGIIVEGSLGRHLHPDQLDDILSHSQNMAASRAVPKGSDKPDISEPEGPKEKVRHSFMETMKVVDTKDSETTVNPSDTVVDVQKDLFLPIIVSEYKKHLSQFIPTSVNQGRIYATAAIKFYAAMGIYGLGVYTVISEGCFVFVTLSYGEEKPDGVGFPDKNKYSLPPHHPPKDGKKDTTELIPSLVHIIERHPFSFNVAEYSGLINFVTFLIKLRIEYVPMVVKTVRAACLKRMGKAPLEDEPQDLQKEMKAHLKSMGIPLGGIYKATWRRHKATK